MSDYSELFRSLSAVTPWDCHRVWAARLLVSCGWAVVLDGEVIEP